MSSEERYPVKRKIYMQTVGRLLPRRISEVLRELNPNFVVWVNPDQRNGIDLKVWYDNNLIIACEILNWSFKSRLSEKRKRSIISNLQKFPCRKLLVYTILESRHVSEFGRNGLDVLAIGYQILPRFYYDFFLKANQVIKRKPDSSETRNDIKSIMKDYLDICFPHISIYLQV